MAAVSGRSVGLPIQLVTVGRRANEGLVGYLYVIGTTIIQCVSDYMLLQSTLKDLCGMYINGDDLLWL